MPTAGRLAARGRVTALVALAGALVISPARAEVRPTSDVAAMPVLPVVVDRSTAAEAGATEAGHGDVHDAAAAPVVDLTVLSVLDEHVAAGRHWRLDTDRGAVHVWAPAGYDAATAATVAFVHGYWVDVDEAWAGYRLPQQFALSGINALFVAPEAPASKWEGVMWPSLAELLATVAGAVDVAMPARRLVAVGHSGAYRTLAPWLAHPALDAVVLLDAAYVDHGLVPWLRASRERRLINVVYETGRFSQYLHRRLPSTRRVDGLPLAGLPDARILHVRTDVGHWELVTDGVALPLSLRALAVPRVASAPGDVPLGLPPIAPPPPPSSLRCEMPPGGEPALLIP